MKKIGLVGGIGPASTLDYYKGIIEHYRARTNAQSYPHIVIDSLDLTEMYNLVASKQYVPFTDKLVSSIHNLALGGAEFAAMAANTAHIVYNEVKARSPLPLISIVEETCQAAKANKCKSVIVLGTAFTMSSGLFTEAFEKYGITAHVPSNEEQNAIHNIIFPNLQESIVLPEEKETMLRISRRLVHAHNADAVILGCTELPLIIKEGELDALLIDTTQVHISAIVDYMLQDSGLALANNLIGANM